MRHTKSISILGISFLAASAALPQSPPPTAPVKEVVETYFGQKVVDPYRWMEETKSSEMVGWMKAQNDYTRAVLEKIPARPELAQRIKSLDNAGTSVSAVTWAQGRYFYFKTEPGSDNRKLYVREGLEGNERLLLDPEKLSTKEKHYSIDYFVPSLDGRYVAAGVSVGGSENSVLEIIEASSGRELSDRIDRAQFGAASWRKDGKSFFYNRLAKLTPQSAPTDRYLKSKVFLHTLGSDPDKDPAIFGFELSKSVSMTPEDIPFVAYSPASPWVVGVIAHGVQNERTLYAARIDAVRGAATPWRKVADVDDAVTNLDLRGYTAYFVTHKNAPRFQVVTLDLSHPEKKPAVLVPVSQVGHEPRRCERRALCSGLRRRTRAAAPGSVRRRKGRERCPSLRRRDLGARNRSPAGWSTPPDDLLDKVPALVRVRSQNGESRRHEARAAVARRLLGNRVRGSQGKERRRHDGAALHRAQERHCIGRLTSDLARGIRRLRDHA